MKKREIQRTKRALHTTYTEGNCYIVKKESSDWPMVIQPISGWMGTGIQYPDFWPRAFAKFKFCLESRCNSWPGSISISSTIPLQNTSSEWCSTRSFVWVFFSFSTISTGDCKMLFRSLSWWHDVSGTQQWFTFLLDSTQSWGPGTLSAFSSPAEAGTSARGQRPRYCNPQIEKYFPEAS